MMTDAAAAILRLEQALSVAGDALAAAHLAPLLETDAEIAAALESLALTVPDDPADREGLVASIDRARAALMRCRRLGDALGEVTRASLDGVSGPYTRTGLSPAASVGGALETRG
jgi:hypothetical protein